MLSYQEAKLLLSEKLLNVFNKADGDDDRRPCQAYEEDDRKYVHGKQDEVHAFNCIA